MPEEARVFISYVRADGEEFAQDLLTRIEALVGTDQGCFEYNGILRISAMNATALNGVNRVYRK
jgi:hypothetical protein